jgi:hypothetical protein
MGEVGRRWWGEVHEYARRVLMRPQGINARAGLCCQAAESTHPARRKKMATLGDQGRCMGWLLAGSGPLGIAVLPIPRGLAHVLNGHDWLSNFVRLVFYMNAAARKLTYRMRVGANPG